ncbi:hypothetical protein ACE0DR_29060 [Azotobacter sp. CWF10]
MVRALTVTCAPSWRASAGIVHVHRGHVQAHCASVLHRHVAQATDAEIATQSPGLVSVTFEPL